MSFPYHDPRQPEPFALAYLERLRGSDDIRRTSKPQELRAAPTPCGGKFAYNAPSSTLRGGAPREERRCTPSGADSPGCVGTPRGNGQAQANPI